MPTTPPADAVADASPWSDLAPHLDAAVHRLAPRDRDAILLRYFENKSVRDVASALAISEDAAKQRLSRAVRRLRDLFTSRHLPTTPAALTAGILAHTSAHATPPAVISAACGFALPATATPAIALLAHKTLLMPQLKPLAAILAIAATLTLAIAGAALLLANPPAPTHPPPALATTTTAPTITPVPAANETPNAPDLVREIRAAESWVDDVKSLQITADFAFLPPPPTPPIANAPADTAKPPETLTFGFDDHRLFYEARNTGSRLLDRRAWDGHVAVQVERIPTDDNGASRDLISLESDPYYASASLSSALAWPHASPHRFWWVEPRTAPLTDSLMGGPPENFQITGRETFRGVDCHVLDVYRLDNTYLVSSLLKGSFGVTLHVGVADHRLYGLTTHFIPRDDTDPTADLARKLAREMDAQVTSPAQHTAWIRSLPPKDRQQYFREYYKRLRPRSRATSAYWYADYKEVAPGRWIPMHQGHVLYPQADAPVKPTVQGVRDIRITRVAIDQPLPADAFVWQFTEGAQVYDYRNPANTLQYKYKKQTNPAEWDKTPGDPADLAARHRPNRFDLAVELARRVPVGQPAPDFPADATWINAKPLNLADLAGKLVLLEFFSTATQLSRNDVATLNDLHARAAAINMAVIAVHAANTPIEQVRQWARANGVTYPICLDTPAPNKNPWDGPLFTTYGLLDLPTTRLIDPTGTVILEGPLPTALTVIRKHLPPTPDGL